MIYLPSPGEKDAPDINGKSLKPFARQATALSRRLTDLQALWLLDFACERWEALFSSLSTWRAKLTHFERLADRDYSERKDQPDRDHTDAARPIFERSNYTLGLVSSAIHTVYAKSKAEIFGSRPWLAATPQGISDGELADLITKHSQWKFDQSNLEPVLTDAIQTAINQGTGFVKPKWTTEIETYERTVKVAWSSRDNAAILDEAGDHILDLAQLPPGRETDAVLKEITVEHTHTVYSNIDAAVLDFKNIAFDATAADLDLRATPFFHRFRMGLHDACAQFSLDQYQKEQLVDLANGDAEDEARSHRSEDGTANDGTYSRDPESNPEISLVEGFMRCDPFSNGKPIRLRLIFSPELKILLSVDYLANVSPDAMLPVFPVRCFKVPRRVLGAGYWDIYEGNDTCVDALYNGMLVRARDSIDVFTGLKRQGLKDEAEGKDIILTPDKVMELSENAADISEVLSFAAKPDLTDRFGKLLQDMMEMQQLALGTANAGQGGLAGVPQNDTATGSKLIQNHGETLVGCQIDQMLGDLEKPVEFAVILNYANLDHEETFVWGEGQDAVLHKIEPGSVRDLRANVSLALTQSRNLQQLEQAKGSIEIVNSYAMLPPIFQTAFRKIFAQALKKLGFDDAETMLAEAAQAAQAQAQAEAAAVAAQAGPPPAA